MNIFWNNYTHKEQVKKDIKSLLSFVPEKAVNLLEKIVFVENKKMPVLLGAKASASYFPDRFQIVVSLDVPEERIREVIAHELAHLIQDSQNRFKYDTVYNIEKEATELADMLLSNLKGKRC